MNKSEAVSVLKEIFVVLGETVLIDSVSLDDLDAKVVKNGQGFKIKMKCTMDRVTRNSLKPLLEKHKLALIEENGYVSIAKITHCVL